MAAGNARSDGTIRLVIGDGDDGLLGPDEDTSVRPEPKPREWPPRLRNDLDVEPGEKDTVVVKIRGSAQAFPLYGLEWRVANLMDGERSYEAIAAAMARLGHSCSPALVRSFTRELHGYGFLAEEDEGAAEVARSSDSETSVEEQLLLDAAVAQRNRGNDEEAIDYLLAVLEINPSNARARDTLRDIQSDTGERARPGQEERGRPTDVPLPGETRGEQSAAPAPQPPRRAPLFAIFFGIAVIVAAIGGVGLAIMSRLERIESSRASATAQAPVQNASATQNNRRFRLELSAVIHATVVAPRAGRFMLSCEDGSVVDSEETLGNIVDAKQYAVLQALDREIAQMRSQGGSARVTKYFLRKSRKRRKRLARDLSRVQITAPAKGLVHVVVPNLERDVAAEQPLVELKAPATFTAVLPLDPDTTPLHSTECRVLPPRSERETTCQIRSTTAAESQTRLLEVLIEDPSEQLGPGMWVDIELHSSDAP